MMESLAALDLVKEVSYDETERPLAFGGFSVVREGMWHCPSFSTPRQVAVKSLQGNGREQEKELLPKLLKRLKREVKVWANLSHRNIVPFLGYIVNANTEDVALVSKYCKYGNIRSYLSCHPDADRHLLFTDVVTGLVYLHTTNPTIIHADIKPDNILVDERGTAALCDFGLSVALGDTSSDFSGSSLGAGSIRYMAPEQLDPHCKPTMAIDVYALGCACMEILFAMRPYAKCLTDYSVMAMMGDDQPPFSPQDSVNLPKLLALSWERMPRNRPCAQELTSLEYERKLLDSCRLILMPAQPPDILPGPEESVIPSRLHIRMQLVQLECLSIPDLCGELSRVVKHRSIRTQVAQLLSEDATRLLNLLEKCLASPHLFDNLSDIFELHLDVSFRMQFNRLPTLPSSDLYHALAQIADNQDYRRRATELRGEDAIAIADASQKCISTVPTLNGTERAVILRLLQDVCWLSGELPTSYFLRHVEIDFRRFISRGPESITYKGRFRGRDIAARDAMIDMAGLDAKNITLENRSVHREAVIHAQLHHPNILPFLGIHREGVGAPLIITPFISRGDARQYTRQLDDRKRVELLPQILLGTAEGIAYMHRHTPPILHGAFHDTHILIGDNEEAIIRYFGLSRVQYEVIQAHANVHPGGHPRYLAPELVDSETSLTSPESDVYGLSMVFLSLVTQEAPFPYITRGDAVLRAARGGGRPTRPKTLPFHQPVNDMLWKLLEDMWAPEPAHRPSASFVVPALKEVFTI